MKIVAAVLAASVLLICWRVYAHGSGFQTWFLYQIARVYTRVMFRLKTLTGRTVPEDGAALIIANHTSPVDPMLIWADHRRSFRRAGIRRPGFMMAQEYYEMGGIPGWIFHVMESIPVERDGRDMGPARAALNRLKDGQMVGVFPEGRINDQTPDDQLLSAGSGAAWLALKSQAPVIPIYVHNAPRGTSMGNSFLVRTHSALSYGDPIDLSAWYGKRLTQTMLAEVTDLLMERLAEVGGVLPPEPEATSEQLSST